MENKLNLCDILTDHEGDTFFCPFLGSVRFYGIVDDPQYPIVVMASNGKRYEFTEDGKLLYGDNKTECWLFPSIKELDWKEWERKNNGKTWDTLADTKRNVSYTLSKVGCVSSMIADCGKQPTRVEASVLALLKIRQLIDAYYGGNITDKEWEDETTRKYCIHKVKGELYSYATSATFNHIAFHTFEQREEFLSYPDNKKLVEDFYMVG